MRKIFVVILLNFIVIQSIAQIKFVKLSKEELFELAEKQDKYIFVDVFTDWCGPCIRMDKFVFTDSTVAALYNANMISYKADAERDYGIEWRVKYDIQYFPSYLFLASDGKVICKTGAGMSKELFLSETARSLACDGSKAKYIQLALDAENILIHSQRKKKLIEADTLLQQSLMQTKYFFNLYLAAKLYYLMEEFDLAKEYAQLAIPHLNKLKSRFTNNKYSKKPIPEYVLKLEEELHLYSAQK